MQKTHAIKLLGGTNASAARAIGINPAAVSKWPAVLSPKIRDRVEAAQARLALAGAPMKRERKTAA